MEETTELQIVTQGTSNEEKTPNNTFRIYNYFKEHPSFFLAIISAFIAVISITLHFDAFLSMNSYLIYFGVDNVLYKPSTQFVYLIAISLFYSTILILFQWFISKTFESYTPYVRENLFCKYALKKTKTFVKKDKKSRKYLKNRLQKLSKALPESDEIQQLKKDMTNLEENGKVIEIEYKSIKKAHQKTRVFYRFLIALSCFVVWFVLCLIYSFMLSVFSYDWYAKICSALLYYFIYVLVFAIINWFFSCVLQINRSKIKSDAQSDEDNRLLYYTDLPDLPISKLVMFKGDFKSIFSDANCKKISVAVIISLLALIMATSWSGAKTASDQKEFFIVEINTQQYALIYNNGENAVLERVQINGENITIDTRYQKVVFSNTLEMEKRKFGNVDVVRVKENMSGEQNKEE